jgi:hypothetical protein
MRFLILSLLIYFSAEGLTYSQQFLAFDRQHAKRVYFPVGSDIRIKLKGEDDFTTRRITAIHDSTFTLDNLQVVKPTDVTKLHMRSNRKRKGLKTLFLFGGLMFPALSGVNAAINHTRPIFSTWSLICGGVLVTTYAIVAIIDKVGITYTIGPKRPLKILNITQ